MGLKNYIQTIPKASTLKVQASPATPVFCLLFNCLTNDDLTRSLLYSPRDYQKTCRFVNFAVRSVCTIQTVVFFAFYNGRSRRAVQINAIFYKVRIAKNTLKYA